MKIFLKNLFKKQPIVQKTLNLGKITATIYFKNGQTLEKTFEGKYHYSELWEADRWFDNYTDVEELYQEFLAETQFVKLDEKTAIKSRPQFCSEDGQGRIPSLLFRRQKEI